MTAIFQGEDPDKNLNYLGQIVESLGFVALNLSVAFLSILYVPMLYYLKDMHDYQSYESEEPGVVMKDPPDKEFQTIALQETNVSNGYQQQTYTEEETGFANFEGTSYTQPPNESGATAAPSANPFKKQGQNNPFKQ